MPKTKSDKRDVCFTLNCSDRASKHENVRDILEEELHALFSKVEDMVDYFVAGYEIGGIKHRPHYQGFIQFKTPKQLVADLKPLNSRIHWEYRKGTPEQAATYCTKDEDALEYGKIQHREVPVVFQDLIDTINNGGDVYDPKFTKYHLMYGKKIADLMERLHPDVPMQTKPHVHWFYGPPEQGKTRGAKDDMRILLGPNKRWYDWVHDSSFQNYNNEECILIDDIRPKTMPFTSLLRLLDWGSTRVDRKNRDPIYIKAKHIYITNPHHPSTFQVPGEDMYQLVRRIDDIKHFDHNTVFT